MTGLGLVQASGVKWGSKEGRLPLREYIRNNWPRPAIGPVVEDLDLIIRRYGACNGLDEYGAFSWLEHKSCFDRTCDCEEALTPTPRPKKPRTLETAQRTTFGVMDAVCRGSIYAERYWGFWVLTTEHRDPLKSSWLFLNGVEVGLADLADFIDAGRSTTVPAHDFGIQL